MISPAALQRIFAYETRKKMLIQEPDYDIDGGFGGPVPLIGKMLGNLRFYTSYRTNREMLLIPLSRPDYRDYDWTFQLNMDITKSIKFQFFSSAGKQYTINSNSDMQSVSSYPNSPGQIAELVNPDEYSNIDFYKIFSDFYFPLADIGYRSLSAKLTSTINSKTFYEISVNQFRREYNTRPNAMRDNSKQYEIIPGFYEDSNPFGYWDGDSKGLILTGSSYASLVRDFTVSKSTSIKAEISSQLNFYNLVKAGTEYTSIYLDFEKGIIQPFTNNKKYQGHLTMNGSPVQAAFFIQDKFESKQFSVNAGLRLEYFDLHSNWFRLNDKYMNPYYRSTTILDKMDSKAKWKLSPRFGAACMLTNTTRMFFNYGHFYQPQQYENLYQIPSTSNQEMISWNDPNIEPVKTISYEAGLEQTFIKDFLFHVNFYLNSISNISGFVSNNYSSYGFSVTHLSDNIKRTNRGIELSLQKTKGRWLTGFINYTYQVNKTNSSSSSKYYDDHYIQKQWDLRASKIEDKPEPRPFARAAINLHTPDGYGPSLFAHNLLGGLGLNFIIDWQSGGKFTWNPEKRSVVYNVEAVDFFNTALRLDKIVNLGKIKLQVFLDIDNVFNTLRLWDVNNYYYLYSLHLPESNAYNNIPGDDKIGDYRKPGVEFQPMQYIQEIDFSEPPARTRAIYYEKKSGQFWQYTDNKNLPVAERWKIVDAARIEKINKDKAYIDMPSASTFWFLNPRKIYFGINVSFNF